MKSSTSILGFDAFYTVRNFRDSDYLANQKGIIFNSGRTSIYCDGVLVAGLGVNGDGSTKTT